MKLDILGIQVGHLPSIFPFSMATPAIFNATNSPRTDPRPPSHITKHEILLVLRDSEAFYELYGAISNRAIDTYVRGGRRKFALKLHGCLAALDTCVCSHMTPYLSEFSCSHRGRLNNALTVFSSLPAHYAPHMWTSLESLMLSRAIDMHVQLETLHNREWVHIMLALLKTYADGPGLEFSMPQNAEEYIAAQVTALRQAAESLESGHICSSSIFEYILILFVELDYSEHPAICVSVVSEVRCSDHEDLLSLSVIVHNRLPCVRPFSYFGSIA